MLLKFAKPRLFLVSPNQTTQLLVACQKEHLVNNGGMDLQVIRKEIEDRRRQINRQRHEIRSLERSGIRTVSAEELLGRMQAKVDELVVQRDRMVGEQRIKYPGTDKFIRGASRR